MTRLWTALALGGLLAAATAAWASDISPDRAQALREMLAGTCASCHGADLGGMVGPPLTADALKGKDKDMLVDTILNGRPGTPMAAFSGMVDQADAAWLVEHLQAGTALK
jgi:cytochrome c55X